jgi:hypothetical protein
VGPFDNYRQEARDSPFRRLIPDNISGSPSDDLGFGELRTTPEKTLLETLFLVSVWTLL